MKIHVLPVAAKFQPTQQAFRYPGHNDAYDVEQDFLSYLKDHPDLIASVPEEADWSYLPILWTRWHMAHDYAKQGRAELQAEVDRVLNGVTRAFTVCLYEDGPLVNIGSTILLTATRKPTTVNGVDIPTICAMHPTFSIGKRYRASFVGRFHTNPVRQEMAAALAGRLDTFIRDGDFGQRTFVETILASDIALCPSGGSGSFRFYEAMQLGVVPLLIHEIDTRPFKRVIDWDSCSMHIQSAEGISEALDRFDAATLREMGRCAANVYRDCLAYQKWCGYALQELECASV